MSKTVLITGASTGMGEALTFEYAARGWNVAATMRDTAKANPAFAGLDNVLVTCLDVTDTAGIERAVRGDLVRSMAAVADVTGTDEPPLHLAVATAGLEMVRGRFAELMDEYARWEKVTAATD
ncbi:SDR family NAD(P)-dependent oxidoreductase [Streptomyces sasae]|uniref:SDR family NAD(P)-dependent oxidoreductase n=1 Tax=Streptomyces sasae TaxID=1266772 RepID=UPI00292E2D3C|nr:SDR family NAD(P)-dependent oxidoreductase [Streptomyces sasae]